MIFVWFGLIAINTATFIFNIVNKNIGLACCSSVGIAASVYGLITTLGG